MLFVLCCFSVFVVRLFVFEFCEKMAMMRRFWIWTLKGTITVHVSTVRDADLDRTSFVVV